MKKRLYLKKEDNFFQRRRKLLKENEECIWTRKICFFAEENVNSRGKGRKYLEKENMFFAEEKNNEERKG